MRSPALSVALVFAIGAGAIATAQNGGGPPEDPGAIADEASAFGECISEAAQAGAEDPQALCAELKPGAGESKNGDSTRSAEDTHAAACEGESKEDGSFGRCVSERASAFGRCVSEQAKAGTARPAEACADLRPGNGGGNGEAGTAGGPPEGVPTGQPVGTPSGPPEGVPAGKPEGTPNDPPADVPTGKPDGTPSGPPEGVPAGKPEGTPGGPGSE